MLKKPLAIAAIAFSLASPAHAGEPKLLSGVKPDTSIAAVVGGEAISSYDVDNRVRFIIATTKLPDRADVTERIRPQILRSLIDEKLQLQEAARHDIVITGPDIGEAVSAIEQQRGMPTGSIFAMLSKDKIPHETFTEQIRAQLAWNQLMMKEMRPHVKVSEEEIQLAAAQYVAPVAIKELEIATISLPVDKPGRAGEIKRLADKLAKEIRAGANFEELMRQFSSNASRSGKTETFWVRPSQLDPAIGQALAGAKQGTVTDALRTNDGYAIVKVYNIRAQEADKSKNVEVQLKEILLRLKPDATTKEADVLLQIGENVAKDPGTCEEKGLANIKDLNDFDIEVSFRRSAVGELPPALKIIAESLKVGDISTPFASSEGIRLYMLCDKKEGGEIAADTTRIKNQLMQQKLELEAQKYMRNLRRDGFVEIR